MKKSIPYILLAGLFLLITASQLIGQVTGSGRDIMVNGLRYEIRGMCYHPVPKGETMRSFDRLEEDLALMNEAGINTIRVYAPITEATVLDRIHDAGIKVIIGFGYNQDGHFDILSGTFISYVNQFRHHDAILMWELGNEYNYHPEWFENDMDNWYSAMNEAARLIHQHDPDRPVSTAHGELPTTEVLERCPDIDVWGMNVYRWDDPGSIFTDWSVISTKPMYLSEAGADSYMTIKSRGYDQGINEKAQADALTSILASVFEHREICSGVTVFSFTDGWWKAGSPDTQDPGGWAPNSIGVPYDGAPNEEYWGVVDINRNKKEAFRVLQKYYRDSTW